MSFFDAPWHWVLLLFAALLLFGSSRLPGAAKALGQSMNIFKKAVKGDEDDQVNARTTQATFVPPPPPAEIADAPSPAAQQAQIDDLQRQLRDLQRPQSTGDAVPGNGAAEAQPRGQSY